MVLLMKTLPKMTPLRNRYTIPDTRYTIPDTNDQKHSPAPFRSQSPASSFGYHGSFGLPAALRTGADESLFDPSRKPSPIVRLPPLQIRVVV
jgi:hypothetical protein